MDRTSVLAVVELAERQPVHREGVHLAASSHWASRIEGLHPQYQVPHLAIEAAASHTDLLWLGVAGQLPGMEVAEHDDGSQSASRRGAP